MRKGIFIPDITVEMFKNASLEAVEELLVSGTMEDIEIPDRPHGECGTCKHFVKGGLDGKTYVCEHPCIEREDYYDYACLEVEEKDFCSYYENYESKEGVKLENDRRGIPGIPEEK